MAVAVKRDWQTVLHEQIAQHRHVAVHVLRGKKASSFNGVRGIVNEHDQTVFVFVVLKPLVLASVDLKQLPAA